MKQKINIDSYVGKSGKYIYDKNNSFRQKFSIIELKHINMIMRINRINKLCSEHIREWKKRKNNWNNVNYEFSFLQEEIIFHLRRAVDDMITIVWMQNEVENERDITKIKIDSIGKYLSKKNCSFHYFDKCLEFLDVINTISNSYKHSAFQPVQVIISRNEPGFYIFNFQANDTEKGVQEKFYSQSKLLLDFEKMFLIYISLVYE